MNEESYSFDEAFGSEQPEHEAYRKMPEDVKEHLEKGTKLGFYVRKPRQSVQLRPKFHGMLWEIKREFLDIDLHEIAELAIKNFLAMQYRKRQRQEQKDNGG